MCAHPSPTFLGLTFEKRIETSMKFNYFQNNREINQMPDRKILAFNYNT